MAQKKFWLGSRGPYFFDDANQFSDGTNHGLKCEKVPTDAEDVLRLDDLGTIFAPADSTYVVVSLDGTLTDERRLQVGSGLTLGDGGAGGDITIGVDEANIDHDSLQNFVAAEHIDWSVTGAEDVHDDRIAESSVTQHEAAIDHDALTNFVADEHIDWTNTSNNLVTTGKIGGGQGYFDAALEDKVSLYADRLGATNMYGFGVESSALYYKAAGAHRWYANANADAGVSSIMILKSTGHLALLASLTSDSAPNDDTTLKNISIQKLASPPSNAAYVAFSNNPGTDTFYLVLEEG